MPRRKAGARVLGPYPDGNSWRVVFVEYVDGQRKRTSETYAREDQAQRAAEKLREGLAEVGGKTIEEAIDAYEEHLREKGNKPGSVKETVRRLLAVYGSMGAGPDFKSALLVQHSTEEYKQAYHHLVSRLSVDSHRNILAETKSFLRWCVVKGYIPKSPAEGIQGVGKRSSGKKQLRIDEANTWLEKAYELAPTEPGAVAAIMTLQMGLRASEITKRVVRDLDWDGRILWVEDAKTKKGNRAVDVPERLRQHLAALCAGKAPTDMLFGHHWRDWPSTWVRRICRLVGVLEVRSHAMRGLYGTIHRELGGSLADIANRMGHESSTTTQRSYIDPETEARARQRSVLEVLRGASNRSAIVPPELDNEKRTKLSN